MVVRVDVLGPLEVTVGSEPAAVPGRRLQTVLGVLALRAGRPVSVSELIDATWPAGSEPPTAVKTVRSHVAHVRQALRAHGGEGALRPSPPGYLLAVPAAAVDRFRFERAAAAGREHRRRGDHAMAVAEFRTALRLWRSEVLAGCELHGWAAADATRLAQARLLVTEDRVDAELAGGVHREALAELEYLVQRHPFRERLWELLMLALHADGRQGDALAAYQRARAVLRDELGVDPGRRLRQLESAILRGEPLPPTTPAGQAAPGARAAPTAPAAPTAQRETGADAGPRADTGPRAGAAAPAGAATRGALPGAPPPQPAGRVPAPITPLVGRDAETRAVAELVLNHRLVTVSGPGGCGKTRVAIAACQALGPAGTPPSRPGIPPSQAGGAFDPVVFLDLAAVADSALVEPSVAAALGLPQHPDQPIADAVAQCYARHRALLVLDDCAHVVAECARLVEALLAGCASLHVLVTSRVALGLAGETVRWLRGLPVPPAGSPAPGAGEIEDLGRYDGVRLFAQRAGIDDLATLTPTDAAALRAVCASVDGLPLALELAAARARVLSLPELAAAMRADRLGVLTSGPRTALPRHRTLRACVQWSYRLLDPDEQGLLRALAVVAGTCDLPAVAALCPQPKSSIVALDLVDNLVSQSLVVTERQRTGTRYRMLDTIRQFAAEQLASRPEEHAIANSRHAAHYGWLAEELDSRLHGTEPEQVLDRLTAEHDNLRAAMAWLTSSARPLPDADAVAALRLSRALWQYCYLRGHYADGRRWLHDALAATTGVPADPVLVGAALDGAAALAHFGCDYREATELGERALASYRELADPRGTALALSRLGSVAREQADYPKAIRLHTEALRLFRQAADARGIGHSLQLLGLASWLSGDLGAATEWSSRALRALSEVGDKERIAWCLLDRGAEAHYLDNDDAAAGHLDTARQLFAEIDFKEGLAWTDDLLALIDLRRGELPAAIRRLAASVRLHHELGYRWRLASVLESLARVAMLVRTPAACGDLLGMAAATREAIGAPPPRCERPQLRRTRAWLHRTAGHATGRWDGPPSLAVVAGRVAELAGRVRDSAEPMS